MIGTVIEGTWEEVLARAPELAGRRVRLTVISPAEVDGAPALPDEGERLGLLLEAWQRTPLMDAELEILDGADRSPRDQPDPPSA